MSDTKRGGKPAGYDFGAKYKCDKGYCAGTGKAPKKLASKERRSEAVVMARLYRVEVDDD